MDDPIDINPYIIANKTESQKLPQIRFQTDVLAIRTQCKTSTYSCIKM